MVFLLGWLEKNGGDIIAWSDWTRDLACATFSFFHWFNAEHVFLLKINIHWFH